MTHPVTPWSRLLVALLVALLAPLCLAQAPAADPGDELQEVAAEGMHAILASPGIQRQGARDADVTLIEYFDYNCPYCRRMVPTFAQLVAGDRKLVIVYKDWPILGEVSEYAARCALAASYQGKYLAAHDALLDGPRLASHEVVDKLLVSAGIDPVRLGKDLAAHGAAIDGLLARHAAEAHALLLDGTPGIIVGRQLMPGGAELGYIQNLVRLARSERAHAPQLKP
jgi:protein-disulfide isomerase